jgi:tetratricopeptide (TPR) repeat protein
MNRLWFLGRVQEVVMNIRLVVRIALVLLFSFSLAGQEIVQDASQPVGAAAVKRERELLISRLEAGARRGEANREANIDVGKICGQLGLIYQDVGQWARAEAALERAVLLLRPDEASKRELVTAIGDLGNLHVVMGKLRESEKEDKEALRLAEELGDKVAIAQSRDRLAALALAQHKYERARDYAQKAAAEFAANEKSEPFDVVSARYTLALADCHLGDYRHAIPLLTDAVDEAKTKMQARDLPAGFGEFLLGYALWKSGDTSAARAHLEEGIAVVKEQLGWGHPVYLRMLGHYAQYLRETRRVEAANDVMREIRRTEDVVDVRSLGVRSTANSFDGLR